MAMFPDVQRKARAELDATVGAERLPEIEDDLPYIHAVVMESLRWIPTVPLGVPHRVTTDDEFRGYRIPKGSMIIPVSCCDPMKDKQYSGLSVGRMHGRLRLFWLERISPGASGACCTTRCTTRVQKYSTPTGFSKTGNSIPTFSIQQKYALGSEEGTLGSPC